MVANGHRILKSNLVRFLVGLAIGVLFFGTLGSRVAVAQISDAPVAFDIPAQPLGTALNTLAVQANLQIFFEQQPVAGQDAPAVVGTMTAQQALQTLLANTNLKFVQNADGTVVVIPRGAVAAKSRAKPADEGAAPVSAPYFAGSPAVPATEGNFMMRARATYLDPHNRSDYFVVPGAPAVPIPANGATTNGRFAPELDAEYFFSPHWSTELALNFPQWHRWYLQDQNPADGRFNVGSFRMMPNFWTIKYDFLPSSVVRPYLGVGANVTSFYDVNAGPLRLSSTTGGVAGQAGFDVRISDHWFLNADAKWARVHPTISEDGVSIGHMKIDPVIYAVGIGYRFGGTPAIAAVPPSLPPPPPPVVAAAPVSAPLDSDGDGVPDSIDRCPGTPPGLKVDAYGCEIDAMVLAGVTFETGSAKLTAESADVLDKVVAVLRQRPNAKAEIHGYTDSRGGDLLNQKLSEKRAASVMAYFVDHGIPADNLSAQGFGKLDPVASNATPEGRAQNRRVTVKFFQPVAR
jgi:outer membrane protein OmpA-like peptidoglycan-associated protein/outer membrane protein W